MLSKIGYRTSGLELENVDTLPDKVVQIFDCTSESLSIEEGQHFDAQCLPDILCGMAQ